MKKQRGERVCVLPYTTSACKNYYQGKALIALAKEGLSEYRNVLGPIWKRHLNQDGSIPSGRDADHVLEATRYDAWREHKDEDDEGAADGDGDEETKEDTDSIAQTQTSESEQSLPAEWVTKHFYSFKWLGPWAQDKYGLSVIMLINNLILIKYFGLRRH